MMIVIYATLVLNDEISRVFCNFFKILIMWVFKLEEGGRGKRAKNGPK